MAQVSRGRIVFDQDDWLAGINLQYQNTLNTVPAPEVGKGLSAATQFNPFRNLGYASPGFVPTDVTTVSAATATIRNACAGFQSSTNYAYLIGSDSKFLGLNIGTATLDITHTITGTGTISGNDIAAYYANVSGTSTSSVFYSYNDAGGGGGWNVGKYTPASGTWDDDFMSTVPATPLSPTGGGKPHPLKVGSDDILYIGDGNLVHAYDGATGTNGTFYDAVLTLPEGYVITCFARVSAPTDYLAVFAYYSPSGPSVSPNTSTPGPAKAFFWDYLSLDPTYVRELNDSLVTAAFEWKGTIGCFTQGHNIVNDGTNRHSRLKLWNGGEFYTVATYIGGSPINGGVDIVGDSIQWNSDGTLFCYGAPYENLKVGLNKLGAGTGTNPGVLRSVGGTSGYQIISTGATTSGGLQYFKQGTYAASSSCSTIVVAPEFERGEKGKVRAVRVDFGATAGATGLPITMNLIVEDGTTTTVISSTALIDSSNITKWYYNPAAGGNLPLFFELRASFSWAAGSANTSAPIPRRVVVDYEKVNVYGT